MAMTGNELRQSFLDYFRERGHAIVRSSRSCPVMTRPFSSPTRA